MRVAALGHADQVADVDQDPAGVRAGRDRFCRPRVVADAVLDEQLGVGDRAAVGGRRFVVVRVGVRVGDDRGRVDAGAAQLG